MSSLSRLQLARNKKGRINNNARKMKIETAKAEKEKIAQKTELERRQKEQDEMEQVVNQVQEECVKANTNLKIAKDKLDNLMKLPDGSDQRAPHDVVLGAAKEFDDALAVANQKKTEFTQMMLSVQKAVQESFEGNQPTAEEIANFERAEKELKVLLEKTQKIDAVQEPQNSV